MVELCGNCGAATDPGARFCAACGSVLGPNAVDPRSGPGVPHAGTGAAPPTGTGSLPPAGGWSASPASPLWGASPTPPESPAPWASSPPVWDSSPAALTPPASAPPSIPGWHDRQAEASLGGRDTAPSERAGSDWLSSAPVPWADALPPTGPISSVPGVPVRAATSEPVANPNPVSIPTPHAPTSATGGHAADWPSPMPDWSIRLDDGRVLALDRPILIGRDPAAQPDAVPLALADGTRSVSKTHARVEVSDGVVLVTDLHSTNGVVIVSDGEPETCRPGVPTVVPTRATVRFGDREFRVLRQGWDTGPR